MSQPAEFLFTIGAILLLGLAADFLGRRTFLPRVSLIVIFGVLMGDDALGIIPGSITQHFEVIANIALLMIGFLLGGKLTSPVIGSGRVLVAAVDQHTIHALDPETGRPLWQYSAGGRIDSPPAIVGDLAVFGCADGSIYCLRMDG